MARSIVCLILGLLLCPLSALLPLELIPLLDLPTSFLPVKSSGLSFPSRAWVLFPLRALTTLVADLC